MPTALSNSSAFPVSAERSVTGTASLAAGEKPLFFPNRDGKSLFGFVHVPVRPVARKLGVLFCHPLGEEKQKCYRIMTRFGRELAAEGFFTLRFDCFGFGDSEGDLVEADLQSQIADVRDAMSWCASEHGIEEFVLIGVRLGGTVAARVAAVDGRVRALMLISPVADGEKYFGEMLRTQQMTFMTRGIKPKKRDELIDELQSLGHIEIDADHLSREMVDELRAVDLPAQLGSFAGACVLVSVAGDDAGAAVTESLQAGYSANGATVECWSDQERDFWTGKVLYEGYYPEALYGRTIAWLKGAPT